QPLADAVRACRGERRRIAHALPLRHGGDVDLGHDLHSPFRRGQHTPQSAPPGEGRDPGRRLGRPSAWGTKPLLGPGGLRAFVRSRPRRDERAMRARRDPLMCNRYGYQHPYQRLLEEFSDVGEIQWDRLEPNSPRIDIRPTDKAPILREGTNGAIE